MKENWKPGTLIYPLPAVLVSCGATPDEYNLLTVAWTGTVCTNPPMCYISVRPERHSYDIIRRTGEFVINLTTEELARATDCAAYVPAATTTNFGKQDLLRLRRPSSRLPSQPKLPCRSNAAYDRSYRWDRTTCFWPKW